MYSINTYVIQNTYTRSLNAVVIFCHLMTKELKIGYEILNVIAHTFMAKTLNIALNTPLNHSGFLQICHIHRL